MPTDFYDVLGAPADASEAELKRAYRSRVREYHPDVNDHPDGDAQFKLIRRAHDVLSDPAERKDYDRMGHRTYADKRLDELPPLTVFPELGEAGNAGSEADPSTTGSGASTSDTDESTVDRSWSTDSSSSSTTSSRSTASSESTSTSRSSNRTQASSQSTSPEQSTASGQAADSRRSTEHRQAAETGRDTSTAQSTATRGSERSGRSRESSSSSKHSSSSWENVAERTARSSSSTSKSSASQRRRGLRRWYGVVLLSLVAYLAGVGTYAAPHVETLTATANALRTAPVATLTATFPLPSSTTYVLETISVATVGSPGVGLLFLVGGVALPLVVLTAVAQFGQGSAWGYALASLGPAVVFVAGSFATLPTAVALLGLLVLPVFSGLGFLIDVGRYLYATR